MASITVSYHWGSGDSIHVHVDSDLDSLADVHAEAVAMWRETWASLEPADGSSEVQQP